MRNIFIASAAILLAVALAPPALAQPDELVVFEDSGQTATYCSFYENESGDGPSMVNVKTPKGDSGLFVFFQEVKDFDIFKTLKPGTPINFSYRVVYFFDESGGGMMAYTGVTEINPAGGAADASACQYFNESATDEYSADKVTGHFCGYKAGTGGAADTVSIKTGKGIYDVAPRLDGLEKMKTLSETALGTPLAYDMSVVKSDSSPPVIALSSYEATGDPVAGACPAARQ
ncbi:MAG: hypothetical protein LBT40_18185 [Deltaproteobacteria bacterium]|jgi:hypothetical protein|nr:hypothetical protein [Deltaproteobacteria bacterium]